jgi:hypothetical protein
MPFRVLTVLFVLIAMAGCGSPGKPAASQAAPQSSDYMQDSGTYAGPYVAGNVPPMEEDRKINSQDCTKEVDVKAGNLMCQ